MDTADIFADPPSPVKDESLFPGKYGKTAEEEIAFESAAKLAHEKLNEAVASSVAKITDKIRLEVHNYIFLQMEQDTEYNFGALVRDRCRTIINGLLSGGYAEAVAKHWLYEFDFKEFRHAAYMANRETFENEVIEDLRKENAKLQQDVEIYRKRWDRG